MDTSTPNPKDSKVSMQIAKRDPWIHRSSSMKCMTCMYFVEKVPEGSDRSNIGRCRRHAPTMKGFPVVFRTDWCGEHKLDETKV